MENASLLTNSSTTAQIINNALLKKDWPQLATVYNFSVLALFSSITSGAIVHSFMKKAPPENLIGGLNAIIDGKRSGAYAVYKLYSEEECRAVPAKSNVLLYHFSCKKRAPFSIVCPGGAYLTVAAAIEGFPIAAELQRNEIHGFVLVYRAGRAAKNRAPMDDLARAVRFIFENADSLNVDTEDYSICGFSAGGHMAACFGTTELGYRHYGLKKPGMLILGYPVITMGEGTHKYSRRIFLGHSPSREDIRLGSAEKNIHSDYPKTYLWHCSNDGTVDYLNSVMLAAALRDGGIPFRLKTVKADAHGWGLALGTPAEGWLYEALEFWKEK